MSTAPRTLSVDFGELRVGLAITDDDGRFAVPLTTLVRQTDRQVIGQIAALVEQEGVGALVVGDPRGPGGVPGDRSRRARAFAAKLARRTGLDCIFEDETLTSREADSRLRAAGIDPRRDPGIVDRTAAQILLEQFLARQRGSR